MDINMELYRVFYHVAESLSFSTASKELYISQSAVSQSIKALEKKLGQPLFIRSTKKVQLTPAGQLLFDHIKPAMNLIMRGENQLTDSTAIGMGQLHIGASDTICRYFLVPFFERFHREFPSVSIRVTNATSIGCAELLSQGKVDLIFANSPNVYLQSSDIQKTVADFCDVFVANPSAFPNLDKPLSLSDLNHYPLMMLERHSTTSEFLHNLFLQNRLELVPAIELNSNDLLLDFAKIGLGIAIVPDYCIKDSDTSLVPLKIKERMPARQIIAAANASLPLTAAAQQFLNLF